VLKIEGPLQSITETNCYVMQRTRDALQPLVKQKIEIRGTTDLTIGDSKFSGNAQRRRRNFLLFHGSFLLQFDLELMVQLLKFPSRQPDYRANRAHTEFLTQLALPQETVKEALQKEWNANESSQTFPQSLVENLVQNRYASDEWNLKW
jgi:lipoate-protein ligase A